MKRKKTIECQMTIHLEGCDEKLDPGIYNILIEKTDVNLDKGTTVLYCKEIWKEND